MVEKSPSIVQYLEPLISTKKKEEIARCLVNIHEKASESDVAVFLSSIVDQELDTHGMFSNWHFWSYAEANRFMIDGLETTINVALTVI